MTVSIESEVDPIIKRLETLSRDLPYLRSAVLFYKAVLPLLRDADIRTGPVTLTPEQARSKMTMGLPLLHDLDLELNGQSMKDLMLRIAGAIENLGENKQLPQEGPSYEAGIAARSIRLALEENRLDVNELMPVIAAGKREVVTSVAEDLQLDADLLWTFAQNVFRPLLHAWRRKLSPLAEGIDWCRGYCFICGSDATFGELQGNNQVKHLRCSQCGADWPFRRVECAWCGNEGHMTLGYLYSENQADKLRIEVCEKCKGYLKVIATFTPTPPEMLTVEDLATLHLDCIALESRYKRRGGPPSAAFGSRAPL